MTITFDQEARPTVWLLEGALTYKGTQYPFWYEYDERDGERRLEFKADEPDWTFDSTTFEDACQAQLEKSYRIADGLSSESIEVTVWE